jgi:polyisoprenoid-binding protein YceI
LALRRFLWHAGLRGGRSCLIALSAALAGPALAADNYTLDSLHSIPVFEFKHLGLTTQTGRFEKVSGTVVLDPVARQGSVSYEVETSSLNMGFGTENPDSPGYRLFDVAKYPKIIFRSTRLMFDNHNAVTAAVGQITLLGVTKPLTVTVNRFRCSANPMNKKMMCAGNVTATIKRSDFGMVGYIPVISDEINLNIPVEAYKN